MEVKRIVRVAILDSGVADHDDLEDRLLLGVSVIADLSTRDHPNDHGTGMAGIIGGRHDSDWVDGVAEKAVIEPVRIAQDLYTDPGRFEAGLQKIIELKNIAVVAAAVSFPSNGDPCPMFDDEMKKLKDNGIVIVASVPNEGDIAEYPAACGERFENLLVVGAVDKKGKYCSSTSIDPQLVAPGDFVCTLYPDRLPVLWNKSSSAAVAFTAGAMALVLSAYDAESTTAASILDRFLKSAKTIRGRRALCLEGLTPSSGTLDGACDWPG